MTPEQLKEAGFSDAEVSQYRTLQGAGFSTDEIIKHFEGEKTPAPPKTPSRSFTTFPRDVLHGIEVGASGLNKGLANLVGMLSGDAARWVVSQLGADPEKIPGLRGGVWGEISQLGLEGRRCHRGLGTQ